MARKDVLRTDYRRVCTLAHLLPSALTTEFPSLHLSFSGSSSVAVARTEQVQSRQIAVLLFLPPRSTPAALSPGSRFRFLATGNRRRLARQNRLDRSPHPVPCLRCSG